MSVLRVAQLWCLTLVVAFADESVSRRQKFRTPQSLQPSQLAVEQNKSQPWDVPMVGPTDAPAEPVAASLATATDKPLASVNKEFNFMEVGSTWVVMIVLTALALRMMKGKDWVPKHRAPYTAGLLIFWTILIFATIFYSLNTHGWSWLECIYFCCVTVTTVGYGDYVPYNTTLESVMLIFFLWFNIFILSIVFSVVTNSADEDLEGDQGKGLYFHIGCIAVLVVGGGSGMAFLEGWTFVEGLFFATVTLTTVGYGALLPNSGPLSMICACIFMLVGVPMTGCFVGSLGGAMDDKLKHIKDTMSSGSKLAAYVGVIVGWALFGATLFHQMNSHGWTWSECLYFSAVTMTTVGYGDYVPTKTDSDRILCAIFIWASVVVIATVFSDLTGALIDIFTAGMHRHKTVVVQCAMLGVIIASGVGLFAVFEGWGILQGLVFTSVTCTTVGYGHYLPESDAAKLACVPFVLIAVPFTGALAGNISSKYSDEVGTLIADVD